MGRGVVGSAALHPIIDIKVSIVNPNPDGYKKKVLSCAVFFDS
jgi:hypothetical protein